MIGTQERMAPTNEPCHSDTPGHTEEVVRAESFDPALVRPWRFHNRAGSGMDEASLDALAASIRRDGQQQLGLARRLPPGDTHAVEVIFGLRRLEACRRVGVPWRAEVREPSFPDSACATIMHGENEWTENVSPLENALQWKAMLDAGVFANQSALAVDLGCHRGTVSRAIRTATSLFAEPWLERLVYPVMHEFTGRSADRLADALSDPAKRRRAKRRAPALVPGDIPARQLYEALLGDHPGNARRETTFVRRKGRAGGGMVAVKIQRDGAGGFSVNVRPHNQSAAELAELAEHIESLITTETGNASGVRLGRRLATALTPEAAKTAERSWLEGCVWAFARTAGLDWDRWRCMAVADALRTQRGGWEHAILAIAKNVQADAVQVPESP